MSQKSTVTSQQASQSPHHTSHKAVFTTRLLAPPKVKHATVHGLIYTEMSSLVLFWLVFL
jgi:hypothetical protein